MQLRSLFFSFLVFKKLEPNGIDKLSDYIRQIVFFCVEY